MSLRLRHSIDPSRADDDTVYGHLVHIGDGSNLNAHVTTRVLALVLPLKTSSVHYGRPKCQ